MIKFNAERDAEGNIRCFEVDGHSGFADSGEDIVCAAVSSVVWMTINGIEKQNLARISYEERDGFVKCALEEIFSESANVLLNSLILFIKELEAQYKDFLRFTQS